MTAAEQAAPVRDPYRWPYVRVVNKPKIPAEPGTPGGAVPGIKTKLYVDGVDMSNSVGSVTVTSHYKDAVRAVIEILPTEVEFDNVVPTVGPSSRELLTRLGWTPPAYDKDDGWTAILGGNVAQARGVLNRHAPGGFPELEDLYTLLLLAKGQDCSPEDVHHAWSLWRSRTCPDHPSLVPFHELPDEVKQRELEYAETIQAAARSLEAADAR